MIFLDKLSQHRDFGSIMSKVAEGATVIRVHRDVANLALKLAEEDKDKLLKAGRLLFAPDYDTWLDVDLGEGNLGFYFHGTQGQSITRGDTLLFMQRHSEEDPLLIPSHLNLQTGAFRLGYDPTSQKRLPVPMTDHGLDHFAGGQFLATMTPLILAILALVNSPKVVAKVWNDNAKLNAKRVSRGKYAYHPHHAVRLNVDKKALRTTGAVGQGQSKALHMVRAHLRLVGDRYVLVSPHWRGDPKVGIMRTTYEVDRNNSRWRD